jgi:hypothetical protein
VSKSANGKFMKGKGWFFIIFIPLLSTCAFDDTQRISLVKESVNFKDGYSGWTADFAYYPASEDSIDNELETAFTYLPRKLNGIQGVKLEGTNNGTNLFMFLKKKITGLKPNTPYIIAYHVEYATNKSVADKDGEGKSVHLMAGATPLEPKKVVEKKLVVLNIDKGTYNDLGEDMVVLGPLGAKESDGENYQLVQRNNANENAAFYATSNSKGELWVVIGTESNFVGRTTIYYTKFNLVFTTSY